MNSSETPGTGAQPLRIGSREFVAERNAAVFAGRVRLLYRLSVPGYVGTLINAVVLVAALWPIASRAELLAWFGLVAVITGGRYLLYRRFTARATGQRSACRRFRWRSICRRASSGGRISPTP